MLRVNNLTGFGGSGLPFSLTNTATAVNTTNLTTYTFSTQALGAGGRGRRYTVVAVGYSDSSAATISSLTVGGLAASVVSDGVTSASARNLTGGVTGAAIYIVETTSLGTTGDVVVTMSEATFGTGISVYSLLNPSSSQATDVTVDTTDTNGLIDVSVTISSGGAAVACTQQAVGGTSTWVGVTEDYDADSGGGNYFFSAGNGGSSGSPHTITCQSADTTPDVMVGVSASWSP